MEVVIGRVPQTCQAKMRRVLNRWMEGNPVGGKLKITRTDISTTMVLRKQRIHGDIVGQR